MAAPDLTAVPKPAPASESDPRGRPVAEGSTAEAMDATAVQAAPMQTQTENAMVTQPVDAPSAVRTRSEPLDLSGIQAPQETVDYRVQAAAAECIDNRARPTPRDAISNRYLQPFQDKLLEPLNKGRGRRERRRK